MEKKEEENIIIIALDDDDPEKVDAVLEKVNKSIYVMTTSSRKMSEIVEALRSRRGETNE